RAPFDKFQPAMYQQVCAPLGNNFNIRKWKPLGILDLFGDNEGIDAAQRFYLPVNVQHLRLEKAGAVARYNPSAHKQRPVSLGIPDLSIFNWRDMSVVRYITANVSFKARMPSPLAADVGRTLILGNLSR